MSQVPRPKISKIAARARDIAGGAGVAVAYDGVGAATFQASLDSLASRGLLVLFGRPSGPVPPLALGAPSPAGKERPRHDGGAADLLGQSF